MTALGFEYGVLHTLVTSYSVYPGEPGILVCLPIIVSRFYPNKTCFSSQDLSCSLVGS